MLWQHSPPACALPPRPVDVEFMGMADYVSESFHDLLTGVSENISDSDSSEASHHPSHECFMANIPNGHVKEDGAGDATPTANSSERSGGDTGASPPHQ